MTIALVLSLIGNVVLAVLYVRKRRPVIVHIDDHEEPDEPPEEPKEKRPDIGAIERQGE